MYHIIEMAIPAPYPPPDNRSHLWAIFYRLSKHDKASEESLPEDFALKHSQKSPINAFQGPYQGSEDPHAAQRSRGWQMTRYPIAELESSQPSSGKARQSQAW